MTATYSATNETIFLEVPIGDVVPSALNPRKHFDETALAELAESIREHGILEPLVVKPFFPDIDQAAAAAGYRRIVPGADDERARSEAAGKIRGDLRAALNHGDGFRIQARLGPDWRQISEAYRWIALLDGWLADVGPAEGYPTTTASLTVRTLPKYELIAGERRWRASKLAGLATVPVVVRDGTSLDAAATMKLMLVENLQRADLSPIEEAMGYRQLYELGMKQREIAESVHRSQPAVANAMRILELPADVQERISRGELTASHGIILASYKGLPGIQSRLAAAAVQQAWSTKQLERPWSYNLPDPLKNVVKRLDYNAHFAREQCKGNCPHDAYRDSGYGDAYCLKPSCYDAKNAAVDAENQARVKSLVEKAKSEGKEVLKLSDIPYDSRKEFRYGKDPFPKCLEGCDSMTIALSGKEQVAICTKPACFNRQDKAAERDKKAGAREEHRTLKVALASRVDQISAAGVREMALLATVVLTGGHAAILREIFARHAGIEPKDMPDMSYAGRSTAMKRLAGLDTLTLLRMAVEGVLLGELHEAYEGYGQGEHRKTDWYLEGTSIDGSTPSKLAGPPNESDICAMADAAQEAEASPDGHCARPVVFAIQYGPWEGRSGTLFACGEHAEDLQRRGHELGRAITVQLMQPQEAAKLRCGWAPEPIAPANSGIPQRPGPCTTDCDRLCALRSGDEGDGYPAYCLGYSGPADKAPWEAANV